HESIQWHREVPEHFPACGLRLSVGHLSRTSRPPRTSKLIGSLRGMDRESVSTVLATPLTQELLRSSPLVHLAYIGRDGYPRVIPTGYVWKGGKFVVCTADNAPKVRSLGSNPKVALTIDTQTQPPHILLMRGTASWRSSMASRTTTSRLRTRAFPETSGMASTRRFVAYTHEWRESASRPNGQSSSTSRRRFPKPLRSCWLSANS